MSLTINTKYNQDGWYSPTTIENQNELEQFVNHGSRLIGALQVIENEVVNSTNRLNQAVRTNENVIQRYLNTENSKQWIYNNEVNKYYDLMSKQNNLLGRINYPEIKLWRFKNLLYFRTNSGQLIINNHIEIQKELSSRYGADVHIVNDINDVLRNNNQYRVNTIFVAINNIIIVEEEVFDIYNSYELIQVNNGVWRRNLLAYTRFNKKNAPVRYDSKKYSFTRSVMHFIVENSSNNTQESISQWIGNIGSNIDTMLLLIGNQSLSEDLVVNKVIQTLFDTNLVVTITDEMLSQNFEEIIKGKLFLHINYIPNSEEKKQKLKELIVSILIHKSILSNGHKIPTPLKIIVTIDEPHTFFKDYLEISTTLFIDSEENILKKSNFNSITSLYRGIESSLDYYSEEIKVSPKAKQDIRINENQRYLDSLIEIITDTTVISESELPILDPNSDDFKKYFPMGDYHTYITGQTRMGKSTLLIILFLRYIQNTNSNVILFDVHGDLAKKAKMLVKDKSRLLYISNTLDKSHAASINLFKIDDKSEKNISKMANLILGVIKQIKTDETFSGAMEELLLRCIRVLLRKGGGSFHELYRFTNDKRNSDLVEYAKKCGDILDEEYFQDYFNDTNTKNAIRRRLSTLLNDEDFINMMSGDNKLIDFEKEFNTPGKIIIIDIAKGNMDSYIYYIRFIVEYISVLALKRVDTPKKERVITHLILDEFDNFISAKGNIKTILKEAGKYNLLLTIAHQIISDIKDSTLRDTILTMTGAKVIFRNSNTTLDALNKTLNTKLNDVENLDKGEFYLSVGNNDIVKMKNTDRFLDSSEEISNEQWEEYKQYQLVHNYREIKPKTTSQPTDEEIREMIQQFKEEVKLVLSSQKDIESSSLINIGNNSDKLKEVKSDINYFDANKNIIRPRIRQQEINTLFQLTFGLNDLISNRKFIPQLKSENVNDMFNQTDSGTRSAEFTDNGKTQTEQYYYLEW